MAIHELATMLAAGVSMADAVEAQERGARHPKLITALQAMANGLRQGQSFPVVLESAGLDLPRYVYQLVAAGEMTGNLAGALRDCATQMEYERRTRAELQGALIYPAILVLSGVLAVATLFVFVVPKFANLLNETAQLPWLAWAVLSIGVWSNESSGLLAFAVLLLAGGIAVALRNPALRAHALDQLVRLPVVGEWLMQAEIAQWSKVLGTLLGNRVPLVEALVLSAAGVRIARQRRTLERVTQDAGRHRLVGSVGGAPGGHVHRFEPGAGWRGLRAARGDAAEPGDALWRGRAGANEKGPGADRASGDPADRLCVRPDHYRRGTGDYQRQRHGALNAGYRCRGWLDET